MSDEPQVVKGDSMLAGSPRNLSLAQQQLIRRVPPPHPGPWVMPEPTVPAHLVEFEELRPGSGPHRFYRRAEDAGYEPHVVASAGPRLGAAGKVGKETAVVSVRCVRDGRVEIAACWANSRFDVAFGRRADGGHRVATAYGEVELWLDHGVEADTPVETLTARGAALLAAQTLGAGLVATKVRRGDGTWLYLCPMLTTDGQAAQHMVDMHGFAGDLARHRHEHGWARNHVHVDRPLGET